MHPDGWDALTEYNKKEYSCYVITSTHDDFRLCAMQCSGQSPSAGPAGPVHTLHRYNYI